MNAPTSSAVLAPTVKLLIGGKFIESKTTEWRDVVNPATQQVLARVPFATAEEIDAAVASGRDIAAEGPAADADPAEIERVVALGGRVQRVDLIVQHRRQTIAVYGSLPLRAAPGSAASIRQQDREAVHQQGERFHLGPA